MERGVCFDAWFPHQHCYHPSLPPRRLRMVEDLVDYRATALVWSALGGGSISLPRGKMLASASVRKTTLEENDEKSCVTRRPAR